jgi:flagellar hook-basal body complex protein FliE
MRRGETIVEIPSVNMQIPSLTMPRLETKPAPASEDTGSAAVINGFGKALTNAIQGLDQVQNEADDKSVQLAAGDPVDLHEVMLARETASLDFQLALQVRNKLVEAYQDVMRMQV